MMSAAARIMTRVDAGRNEDTWRISDEKSGVCELLFFFALLFRELFVRKIRK